MDTSLLEKRVYTVPKHTTSDLRCLALLLVEFYNSNTLVTFAVVLAVVLAGRTDNTSVPYGDRPNGVISISVIVEQSLYISDFDTSVCRSEEYFNLLIFLSL